MRTESCGLCSMNSFYRDPRTKLLDPVHRHTDDSWWFCDETWAECIGPYESRQIAAEKAIDYGKQL